MRVRTHQALYGNTVITRGYCSECRSYAFIIDNKLACCNLRVSDDPSAKFKRMSDCSEKRRVPSTKWQRFIMEQQKGCCFYCDRRFGSTVYRGRRSLRLKVNWDHVNPYAYSLNNQDQNFVAACHVCNGIKSSLIFRSVDEARTYIATRREEKGYVDTMPEMRIKFQPETDIATVLQQGLPTQGLVREDLCQKK